MAQTIKKEFRELGIGETFNSLNAHIMEHRRDNFPDRPWDVYMKTGDNEAVWLKTGHKWLFMLNKIVILREVKIIEV